SSLDNFSFSFAVTSCAIACLTATKSAILRSDRILSPRAARQWRRPPNLPERSERFASAALFRLAPPPPATRVQPAADRHPCPCIEKPSSVRSLAVAAARSGY